MRKVPLFDYLPKFKDRFVSLIEAETPVHRLLQFGREIDHSNLYIKREDLTAPIYGGNKVRNLEFLLGQAQKSHAEQVIALAPLGSNFIAALAAQAGRIGIPVTAFHFRPHVSEQMIQHADFTVAQGARMKSYPGPYPINFLLSSLCFSREQLSIGKKTFVMPTGGSNAIGALGHVNAFMEYKKQVEEKQIPQPDYLILGVGTCGTIAGFLAAKILTNDPIKIIGVRCVDRVICNRWRIVNLANQILKVFQSKLSVKMADVCLVDHGLVQYGAEASDAQYWIRHLLEKENIRLDTTYTTKVIGYIASLRNTPNFKGAKILYWHTFSSLAMGRTPPANLRGFWNCSTADFSQNIPLGLNKPWPVANINR